MGRKWMKAKTAKSASSTESMLMQYRLADPLNIRGLGLIDRQRRRGLFLADHFRERHPQPIESVGQLIAVAHRANQNHRLGIGPRKLHDELLAGFQRHRGENSHPAQ